MLGCTRLLFLAVLGPIEDSSIFLSCILKSRSIDLSACLPATSKISSAVFNPYLNLSGVTATELPRLDRLILLLELRWKLDWRLMETFES